MVYQFVFPEVSGYALDLHTEYSERLGSDEHGHPVFDTKRTAMGEMVYQLKYRQDRQAAERLVELAAIFIRDHWPLAAQADCLVPVPSSTARNFQPVHLLAASLGERLSKPLILLSKIRATPGLKGVADQAERSRMLNGVFRASHGQVAGKTCLVVDDLIRSGSTIREAAKALTAGGATQIYGLAFTKTRSKR